MLTDNYCVTHDVSMVDATENRAHEMRCRFPATPKLAPDKFDFILALPILPEPFSTPITEHFGPKRYRRWRKLLYAEDSRCFYCGRSVAQRKITLDHLVPRSRGGKTEASNLLLSCHWCNELKDNGTLGDFANRLELLAERIRRLETHRLTEGGAVC